MSWSAILSVKFCGKVSKVLLGGFTLGNIRPKFGDNCLLVRVLAAVQVIGEGSFTGI